MRGPDARLRPAGSGETTVGAAVGATLCLLSIRHALARARAGVCHDAWQVEPSESTCLAGLERGEAQAALEAELATSKTRLDAAEKARDAAIAARARGATRAADPRRKR
jgi:hypothetical protein